MDILLCSASLLKLGAVQDAVGRIWPNGDYLPKISQRHAASGVPPQPFGDDQILAGALTRARSVWTPAISGDPDRYVLAIENGIAPRCPSAFADLAYVVVLDVDGHITIRSSRFVLVPEDLVIQSRATDGSQTCAQLEAARTPGMDPGDPHAVWSQGKTTRRALLAEAIYEALHAAFDAAWNAEVRL